MRAFFLAVFLVTAVAWSGAVLAVSHVYRLYVDGLACPFCAYGVEKNILALRGVEKLDIDVEGRFHHSRHGNRECPQGRDRQAGRRRFRLYAAPL